MYISAFACNEADICHDNADCVYDELSDSYACQCNEGFSGDGLYCESTEVGKFDTCQYVYIGV
jgi:nidogen (entactin)